MGLRIKGIFILAVLVAAIVFLLPTYQAYRPGGDPATIRNKVTLGLDLQGGMYLDLEVDTTAAIIRTLDSLAVEMEDLFLDNLVDYLHVERSGLGVDLALASGERVDWAQSPYSRMLEPYGLEETGSNAWRITVPSEELERVEANSVSQALEVLRNRVDSLGVAEPSIQRQGETSIVIQLPGLKDREAALEAIGTQAVLEFFMVEENSTPSTMDSAQHTVKYQELRDSTTQKLIGQTPYVLEKRAVLSGETVRDARVAINSADNQPYVQISFNGFGSERFERITSRNRGRRLAIVLDDKVQSAPVIRETISGGEAQISGQFTLKEATNLAIVLRSGALPAPLTIREERTVGATLGEDSIRQGVSSAIVGILLVAVFMFVYYRTPGLFAGFALFLNMLLILVTLAFFQATLTLPGLAGMVLTIGMAVDANVLIFERVREELIRTKKPRAAINEGFQKALWTIVDANITTLVAALALLTFGTGPIKGFAVTLSVGILASMFTAIFVTRFLFELTYLSRRRLTELKI